MTDTPTAKILHQEGFGCPTHPWLDGHEPASMGRDGLDHLLTWAYCAEMSDLTLCTDEPPLGLINNEWVRLGVRAISRHEIDQIVMAIYGQHAPALLSGGDALDFAHEIILTRKRRIRFRVNVVTGQTRNSALGASISLRTIPDAPKSIQELGVEDAIVEAHRMTALSQGLVLTVGATGTGKTTLQAALLRDIAERRPALKIVTIESPIEYVLSTSPNMVGFTVQHEVGRHVKSFADGIRNAMRQKPNVILLGEARDMETMGELINASITGHAVYSTVHAPSVAQAFSRIVKMFPVAQQRSTVATLLDVMRLCITQRLVPKVGGGRVALREYLVFDQATRTKLASVDPDALATAVHREVEAQGQTLLRDAEGKHQSGQISEDTLAIIAAEWRDFTKTEAVP